MEGKTDMYTGGGVVLGATTVAAGGEVLSNTGAHPIISIAICATVAVIALVLARKKALKTNQ